MSVSTIQLFGDTPTYTITTDLDDIPYTLRFAWNGRAAGWWMSLYDEVGETLISGPKRLIPFVPDADLDATTALAGLGDYQTLVVFPRILQGVLVLVSDHQPTGEMSDLGTMTLLYIDGDDLQ